MSDGPPLPVLRSGTSLSTTAPSGPTGAPITSIRVNPSVTFLGINPSATYLGPLTTVFTPPRSCFDTVTQWVGETTQYNIFHGVSGDPKCYPGDVRVLAQTFKGYYYSPGVCPSGFTEACQDQVQWSATVAAVTASLCCPSGFTCGGLTYDSNTARGPYCESSATTSLSKVWIGSSDPTGVPSDDFIYTGVAQRIWMNAVPIAWQSTDESIRARATMIAGRTSASSQTSSTAPAGSGNQSTASGLSTSAKIAIGVCVPLAFIGVAILIFFLLRKKKAKSNVQRQEEYWKAELPGDARVTAAQDPKEMDATGEHITPIPYDGPPVELPAHERR